MPAMPISVEPLIPARDESLLSALAYPVQGVYLLYLDEEVVYVGMSTHIRLRIAQHRKENTKVFNKVLLYQIEDETSRLRTESILILKYLPRYNKGLNLGFANGKVWEIRWAGASKKSKSPRRRRLRRKSSRP
jgi:predicted GIY-YIG superfamily endonuclease